MKKVLPLKTKFSEWAIFKSFSDRNQKGVALVITLLVVLVLLLLILALFILSGTEYVVAVNERDATMALSHAEAALQWAKRVIIDISQATAFATFSDTLQGPDNTVAEDDNLLGLRDLSVPDTVPIAFNLTNEQTSSAIVTRDFGDGNRPYEAFRIGVDANSDGIWDGDTRALIYVRIDDNYDEGAATDDPLADLDRRIQAIIISEYPIYIDLDNNGVELPSNVAIRGIARRRLLAKFGPLSDIPAISTNGSLDISGNPQICGECGTAYAGTDIDIGGDPDVCQNVLAIGTVTGCDPDEVAGECSGDTDPLDLPVINPYDDIFVPAKEIFNTTGDSEFTDDDYDELQCPVWNETTNPGGTKYFALVPKTDGTGKGLIFKAYWDPNPIPPAPNSADGGRWVWRLIDDLDDSNNTMLDDCGRVVSGSVLGVALTADPNAGTSVNDTKNDEFYGIKLSGGWSSEESCIGKPNYPDDSLCTSCPLVDNDFNTPDYFPYPGGVSSIITAGNLPMLPGSYKDDGFRDYNSELKLKEGNPKWDIGANMVFSPLYNAVLFVYGQLNMSGNLSNFCSTDPGNPCSGASPPPPGDRWRVSVIAYSSIEISGNPNYAPAREGFDFLLISGRDLKISGNPGGQGICLDNCETDPGAPAYAGILASHEQVAISGNPSFNGFIIAEDAIDCHETVSAAPGGFSTLNGNPDVHYDCIHPPNPWDEGVRMIGWQEIQ